MKTFYRFGIAEILVTLFLAAFFVLMAASWVLNLPGFTEARAKETAAAWVQTNSIQPKRTSCAHDSDGDGYGSCTVVTQTDEKVYLQCVAGFWQGLFGASGCKEVETTIKFNQGARK
jgi:hypothetical protein